MIALVFNDCNTTKRRNIIRSTFVNYYLEGDFQAPIDLSSINHAVDQSKLDDNSVNDLFSQIRNEVKPNDVFQRSFNVDPKITGGIAKMFSNDMFASIQNPASKSMGANYQSRAQPQIEANNLIGFSGLLGMVNANTAGVNHIQKSGARQGKDIGKSGYQPAFNYDEVRDRPARNPIFVANKIAVMKQEASVSYDRASLPQNQQSNKKPEESHGVIYQGSQIGNINESRTPYVPAQSNILGFNPASELDKHDDDYSRPQQDFSASKRLPDTSVTHQPRQVKEIDESSFMNYQEIGHSDSFVQNTEEIKAKMDVNVRNNLKRFEYDF